MNPNQWNTKQLASGVLTVEHVTELVLEHQEANKLEPDAKAGDLTVASIDRAIARRTAAVSSPVFPAQRCWPMRSLRDGRKPTITSAFRPKERPTHPGLDIFFRYNATIDPAMPVGDGGRDKNWWIPSGTLAVAVADARVAAASWVRTGYRVWLDLEGEFYPGYFHLSELFVNAGDVVRIGDPLGIVGDNPIDHDPDHLHFELHRGSLDTYPRGLTDPALLLAGAIVLPSLEHP